MTSVMRKAMVYLGLSDDDEYDYARGGDQSHDERQVASRSGADYSRGTTSIRPLSRPEGSTATIARPTAVRPIETAEVPAVRVHVIEPIEFGDAQEIGDQLKKSQPTIIVLTDVDAELARRLIDFCSGATYVLGGTMERVAKNVFLLTPSNVEVPPEEKQRLRDRGLYRS